MARMTPKPYELCYILCYITTHASSDMNLLTFKSDQDINSLEIKSWSVKVISFPLQDGLEPEPKGRVLLTFGGSQWFSLSC